jgi:hypothetical protein
MTDKLLAARLVEMEAQLSALAERQGEFENSTLQQLQQIFGTLKGLTEQPAPLRKRAIGFVLPDK